MSDQPLTAPTAQCISALLREGGFPRRGGSGCHGATGFGAYRSSRREDPAVPVVIVTHHEEGFCETEQSWRRYLNTAPQWLYRYAETIAAAGWATEVRAVPEPRLIVSAESTPTTEGQDQ